MAIVLTKATLIDRQVRPIGTKIDDIATAGEIESLLRCNRAVRDGQSDPAGPAAESVDTGSVDTGSEETITEEDAPDELATFLDEHGFSEAILDALNAAGINTLARVVELANEDRYEFASLKGIGDKTEAKLRAALGQ